ncbi:MAG: endonuclease/exonuclease/phosphatase family protein [Prevotella sp.]|nr:endonuclease/exonuclease/phosphatase family protein [Prevotella sp.]
MKKLSILLAVMLLTTMSATAQKKIAAYGVGFYNLENLFDLTHDEGKNDYEFLPEGTYRWNELKYSHKLHNMAQVLSEMGTDVLPGVGCAVIGVSEVENSHCLDDLVAQPELAARGYKYVHVEGPDQRGVDCAMLYNPAFFEVEDVTLYPYVYELQEDIDKNRATRGFLTTKGRLAGDPVAVIVCHLPSRFSGSYYRELGARQARAVVDKILAEEPNRRVFVMGDMNDDPTNKSMVEGFGCKSDIADVGPADMYNPWYNILVKQGKGTLLYDGSWNLFDQIIMSANTLNKAGEKDFTMLKFWKNEIFRRDYLFQTEGKYKGSPKRTTAGGVWLDGYSDHLPVVVYLAKEVQ